MILFQGLLVYAVWLVLSVEALRQVHEPSRFKSPHGSDEISARSRLSSSAGNDNDDLTSVPPDHAFYDNYKKNFSWFDPVKQQALFGIVGSPPSQPQLKKRVPPPNTAPVLPNTDCLGCDQALQGATFQIEDFTVEYFIDNALWIKGQGKSQCIFYSPAYGQDLTVWMAKFGSLSELDPGNDQRYRLSGFATEYACARGMKTIWVVTENWRVGI